jgi:hypothetical protein
MKATYLDIDPVARALKKKFVASSLITGREE